MSAAVMVAITDTGDQVDLIVVPPVFDREAAEQVMTKAADPANVGHAAELLATYAIQSAYATQSAHTSRSARASAPANRAGLLEAVWDNEGGAAAPETRSTE
jgi:hypothetical protein